MKTTVKVAAAVGILFFVLLMWAPWITARAEDLQEFLFTQRKHQNLQFTFGKTPRIALSTEDTTL